jgi:hypothetical protein
MRAAALAVGAGVPLLIVAVERIGPRILGALIGLAAGGIAVTALLRNERGSALLGAHFDCKKA